MKKFKYVFVLLLCGLVVSCSKSQVSCSDPDVQKTVINTVQDMTIKGVVASWGFKSLDDLMNSKDESLDDWTARSTNMKLTQLDRDFAAIRIKEIKQSNQGAAERKAIVPIQIKNIKAGQLEGIRTVSVDNVGNPTCKASFKFADKDNNPVNQPIQYTVQPTDDKKDKYITVQFEN